MKYRKIPLKYFHRSIESNFEFEPKGQIPVTNEGITICFNELHELNIDLLITEKVGNNGLLFVDNDVQPKNEYSPIF